MNPPALPGDQAVVPDRDRPELLSLTDVSKAYGATFASRGVCFTVSRGEVVGLIGANGAGKSTVMRVLAGITVPDTGSFIFNGVTVDLRRFSPFASRRLGIRFVHQEFSLCNSLSVAENFYLEQPNSGLPRPFWQRGYERRARESLAALFPGNGIDPRVPVGDLSIAHRQMVEITRAASDPELKLLILDEPTSSLDARSGKQLRDWMRRRADAGASFIFISHKLPEVAAASDRVIVMRSGRVVLDAPVRQVAVPRMIELMAGEALLAAERSETSAPATASEPLVTVVEGSRFSRERLQLDRGEIVGLAGLEGSGQRAFARALFLAAEERASNGIACRGTAAFVPGDRAREGVFPLWTVATNAAVGLHARARLLAYVRDTVELARAKPWLERMKLDPERVRSPILSLSGGNQQKVLMARAMMVDTDILVLDDPTRGVDIGVKQDFYRFVRDARGCGKLVVWYSSEDIEFLNCDRVLMFDDGTVTGILRGVEITEDAIVSTAFQKRIQAVDTARADVERRHLPIDPMQFLPFLTMLSIFAVIALLNRNAVTMFGIDLLMSAAVPVVLIALGQMFVVGGSEIDLGAGAFAGLINVLSATWLVDRPVIGVLAITAALASYCGFGLLIRLRDIPAIIVTLGTSFVWIGCGYTLQPSPGGSSPGWLTALAIATPGDLPASVWVVIAAAVVASTVNGMRTGTMLRGFGANPSVMEQSGWSPIRAYLTRYLLAGSFGVCAGLAMTAISTASDINAGRSYTLLSVAAVVVGGCALIGGHLAPIGVVSGAITLSLVGSLLGFLEVSTDYNAAVQGILLIGTLFLRTLVARRHA